MREQDGHVCRYCGAFAGTADHVNPRDPDTPVVAACSPCNESKGARSLAEWVASGTAPLGAAQVLIDLGLSA